jgi:predicted secreted protein
MVSMKQWCLGACLSAIVMSAQAVQTSGADIKIAATGEVVTANDRARVIFTIEENDKDKATAASRVNQKMAKGLAILKQYDPRAALRTQGYYTYPVYDENRQSGQTNVVIGWRAGQSVVLTTTNIEQLPKTVAAAQEILSLNGVQFDLAPATRKKQEAALIDDAYARLLERIQMITRAMGKNANEATIISLDMVNDGAGFAPRSEMMRASAVAPLAKSNEVEAPSFEPGETISSMQVTGLVRLK